MANVQINVSWQGWVSTTVDYKCDWHIESSTSRPDFKSYMVKTGERDISPRIMTNVDKWSNADSWSKISIPMTPDYNCKCP